MIVSMHGVVFSVSFCVYGNVCLSKLTPIGASTLTEVSVVDGTGQIVLDGLSCRNTESRLIDCPQSCVHQVHRLVDLRVYMLLTAFIQLDGYLYWRYANIRRFFFFHTFL